MEYKKIIEKGFQTIKDLVEQKLHYMETDFLLSFYSSFSNFVETPNIIKYDEAKVLFFKNKTNYIKANRAILDNLDIFKRDKISYYAEMVNNEPCDIYIIQEYKYFTFMVCAKSNNDLLLSFRIEFTNADDNLIILYTKDNTKYRITDDFMGNIVYAIILARNDKKPKKVLTEKKRRHKITETKTN